MSLRRCVGLLRESYSKWERRAPLTPNQVSRIVTKGVDVLVQPSTKRVYTDAEYVAAGAVLSEDLTPAAAILGVKQVPADALIPERTYLFFSHTIKAQPENMELLDACLEKRVRLIDYECVRQDGNQSAPRLIAFGEFAGRAGMINGLRGVGMRLLALGHSSPFLSIGPAHSYDSYADVRRALGTVGKRIAHGGVPSAFAPFVIGIAGTGNVSRGACDALSAIGPEVIEWVEPADLPALSRLAGVDGPHRHKVYATVFGNEHMVRRSSHEAARDEAAGGGAFDRLEYYSSPELYQPIMHEAIVPHLSLLCTTFYWERRFPRLLSVDMLAALRQRGNERLLGIADITCDVDGAIEPLVRTCDVEEPVFMYDVHGRREAGVGLDGDGIFVMGVDILPAELPREASTHFGEALLPYIDELARPNDAAVLSTAGLPAELAAATITCNGELTPSYAYIQGMRSVVAREAAQEGDALSPSLALALEGSTVISLQGHLFDSNLINRALDTIEAAGGRFELVEVAVRPNPLGGEGLRRSSALLQLTCDGGRVALDTVLTKLRTLAAHTPSAEASIGELPDFCAGEYHRTLSDDAGETPGARGKNAAATGATPSQPTGSATAGSAAVGSVGGSAGGSGRGVSIKSASRRHRILVLGAGMCAGPAVEYLSRDHAGGMGAEVRVIAGKSGEAQQLCASFGRPHVTPLTLSCSPEATADWAAVSALVADSDAVLSLLPAPMHTSVADACISGGSALVTASYVSDDMRRRAEAAAAANVPLLCEMGLDPGMDHMSAMALIDAAHAEGGVVTSFRSLCGGLPAPECADNPLLYKFSWSPAGVLAAMANPATYLEAGARISVPGDQLLASAVPLAHHGIGRALRLEALPNRNSLPYGAMYGIEETAHTVFRGTLRYEGWSALFGEFVALGLTQPTPLPAAAGSWPALLRACGVRPGEATAASTALEWLGAFESETPLAGATIRDAFCSLLESRLAYGDAERDAVLMEHPLTVEYPSTSRCAQHVTSSLIDFGAPGGPSSMSRTVGITAAIGVRCVLDSPPALPQGGVLMPTIAPVYQYALPRLEAEGFAFKDVWRDVQRR